MTVGSLLFDLFISVLIVFLCFIIVSCFVVLIMNIFDDYRTLYKNRERKR